jgi:F-type H+-transporting ATPase subunit b
MPQLEQFDTYLGQVVWLVLTFGVLYFILWKSALPRIAGVLQERQERIEDDLQRAETLKREAEAVLEAYEATVAKTRDEAQSILRASAEQFAEQAASRQEELGSQLAEAAAAAESRISEARHEAIANMRGIAGDVALAAAHKLIDLDISESDADAAVAESMPPEPPGSRGSTGSTGSGERT